jgi:hypothetical protein
VIALAAAIATPAVAAPAVSVESFRFERTLRVARSGPVELVPDGALYAHARPGFSDLRVFDAGGNQVPWRPAPVASSPAERSVDVRDSGRRGGAAVARIDLGPSHGVIDHVTLAVPEDRFVGSVTVSGSDDRRTWTRLSTTQIYAVGGAAPARSTTALLPPTDFRYLEVRATHVSRIAGATVASAPEEERLARVPATVRAGAALVVVDLGHRNVPVDELRIWSSTARYDRPFIVTAGSVTVAAGSLVRLGPARPTVVPVSARTRYLRIAIRNGDDPPLAGLRVEVRARRRPLLVEGGHGRSLTVYYGGNVPAPDYDYARLPTSALALPQAKRGALGAERPNVAYRVVDTRSFVQRHRSLVTIALAVAAAALIATTALAFRRS